MQLPVLACLRCQDPAQHRIPPSQAALLRLRAGASALPARTTASKSKTPSGLNMAAQAAKKLYFGMVTNTDQWNDTTYFSILKDDAEFGQVTPANVMKWVRVALRLPLPFVHTTAPSTHLIFVHLRPQPAGRLPLESRVSTHGSMLICMTAVRDGAVPGELHVPRRGHHCGLYAPHG